MELDKAISQISEIHAQVLRNEVFRGFRTPPLAATSALAFAAAGVQSLWLPAADLAELLVLWASYAALCGVICGTDLLHRCSLKGRRFRQQAMLAMLQFAPALVAGVAIAGVLMLHPTSAALLPGLWTIVFALGIFSSLPYLPRALAWVSSYYLVIGVALLATSQQGVLPSPWTLGLTFGCGQAAIAWLLHRDPETVES